MIKTCWVGGPPQPKKKRLPVEVALTRPMTIHELSAVSGLSVSRLNEKLTEMYKAGKVIQQRTAPSNNVPRLWSLTA